MKARRLLRWSGSKYRFARHLYNMNLDHVNRVYDIFCGSCSISLNIRAKSYLLNDTNIKLINFYRLLRQFPHEIWNEYRGISVEKDIYYKTRSEYNQSNMRGIWWASRFLYLNRYSFNGLYRENLKGKFNVPFGSNFGKGISYSDVVYFAKFLDKSSIFGDDFRDIDILYDNKSLVVIDPPYFTSKESNEYGLGSRSRVNFDSILPMLSKIYDSGTSSIIFYNDYSITNLLDIDYSIIIMDNKRRYGRGLSQRGKYREFAILININL